MQFSRRLGLAGVAALALVLVGCTAFEDPQVPSERARYGGDLGTLTYRAVDRLLAQAPEIAPGSTLVVASVANVQELDKSSPFGNIVADLTRDRLVQQGINVVEPRLRTAMLLKHAQGEMMLSRDPRAMVAPPSAAGVLTGSYAVGGDRIYVSLKLVSRTDARIVSATDYAVPRYRDANGLLSREDMAGR